MKLLLDIGNTRIKWAFADGSSLRDPGAVVHADGHDAAIDAVVGSLRPGVREAVAVCVAGARLADELGTRLAAACGADLRLIAATAHAAGVSNGYEDCTQLGADRWAAIVGGWHHAVGPVVVVDAGTAVTIDLVAAGGHHRGGLILPGLHLMATGLGAGTADIAGFAARGPGPGGEDWFGRSTAEAVARGARFAISAAVQRAVAEFPDEGSPALILTGGDAPDLLDELPAAEHRPLLVLEGLARLGAER